MNIFVFQYLYQTKPFISRQSMSTEIINETLIQMLTISLVMFTELVYYPSSQYYIGGWTFIGLFSLTIAFNFYQIFKTVGRSARLLIIKYYKRFKSKYGSKKKEKEVEKVVVSDVNIAAPSPDPTQIITKPAPVVKEIKKQKKKIKKDKPVKKTDTLK